jgi:hypothetical protein
MVKIWTPPALMLVHACKVRASSCDTQEELFMQSCGSFQMLLVLSP